MTGHRYDEVEAPAQQAIELAREFNRPDIIAHALNNLGNSKSHTDAEQGRALLAESIEIGLELEDPDHAARAMGNTRDPRYLDPLATAAAHNPDEPIIATRSE